MSQELSSILEGGSTNSGDGPITSESSNATNMQPLIRFHRFHGVAIELSLDRSTAKLAEGYSYGGVFSDRPIQVNEKVCLRFVDIQNEMRLSPGLRFGFINIDISTLINAPVLNDLNRPIHAVYWMEWLNNQHYEKDKLLYYYINEKGELRYGINGKELGGIELKINTGGPLWAAIQLLGGFREVQFVDSEALNEVRSSNDNQVEIRGPIKTPNQSAVDHRVRSFININSRNIYRYDHNLVEDRISRYILKQLEGDKRVTLNRSRFENRVRSYYQKQLEKEVRRSNHSQVENGVRHPNHSQIDHDLQVNRIRSFPVNEPLPPSRYQNKLVPFRFHATKGRNIQFYTDSGVAARLDGELRQGYIFSAQPMRLGQTIVIQVLATEDISRGTVALGVTACDPTTLTPEELPDNAEYLLDRPEYWVVHPDAANGLRTGDELGVTLTQYGKLEVTKNNSSDTVTVLHVDHTINLWAFVDVSGPIRRVKLLISEEVVEPSLESFKKEEKAVLPSTSRGTLSECTICLENQVDSVIYKCGHMCMCYNCAVKQWKGVGNGFGRCPMCRGIITDIIRTYIP